MARFRFRLERLLRVRQIEERLARSDWSQSERMAQAAENAQNNARAVLHRGRAELARELEGNLQARAVLTKQALLGGLGRRLSGARENYLTARGQADRLGDHWRTRNAASEALSRLRERDRLAHRREEARREALEMDEVALTRRPTGVRTAPDVLDPPPSLARPSAGSPTQAPTQPPAQAGRSEPEEQDPTPAEADR